MPAAAAELINWRKVDSSNVEKVGWPKSGTSVMFVKFTSGVMYTYQGVSRQRAVAASRAKSVGGYINAKIKPNYQAFKIG